jgi:hypothetical protein
MHYIISASKILEAIPLRILKICQFLVGLVYTLKVRIWIRNVLKRRIRF